MNQEEFLNRIEKLDGEAYVLKADIEKAEVIRITKAWIEMHEITGKFKPLFIIPEKFDIQPLQDFDFSTALKFMKAGYIAERNDTRLAIRDRAIVRILGTEARPYLLTNEDLMAVDYRLTKI